MHRLAAFYLGAFGLVCGAAAQSLHLLSPVAGGSDSSGYGVSDDGLIVSGTSANAQFNDRAVRWVSLGAAQDLGTFGGSYSEQGTVSGDGQVVVGGAALANDSRERAFKWTQAGGMVDLGTFGGNENSFAIDTSLTGAVTVGWCQNASAQLRPVRWTASGIQDLGTLGGTQGMALGVSADGSVVTGFSSDANGSFQAFVWTQSAGMTGIGDLGGGGGQGEGVSGNGRVVVGSSLTGNSERHAFYWTADGGMQDLGAALGGTSEAFDTNFDGSVTVGRGDNEDGFFALLWRNSGAVDLNVEFANLIPTGWKLVEANAVSADGRFVVGVAENDNLEERAYLLDRGANTETVAPSSFAVNLGRVTFGSVRSLASIDLDALQICKFFIPNQQSPIVQFVTDGNTTVSNPSSLVYQSTARMIDAGAFQQTLELFNFATQSFDALRTDPLTLTFTTFVGAPAAVAPYVGANGALRGRVKLRQVGPSATLLPCAEWEMVNWVVGR